MQIKNSIILLLLFFYTTASAQPPDSGISMRSTHKGLTVGDKVPDIFIPKIINDNKESAKIADFKDQLLIFDFWATGCSGCVAALPRFEALQKQFGNTVKILPVTYEKKLLVSNFLKKNKYINGVVIPSVVEDRILSSWFKYKSISHEVWIYKGKVVAVTDPGYLTPSNIQFILDGKKNNWLVKDDFLPAFNSDKPLLRLDEKQYLDKETPFYYAAVFGYRDGTDRLEKTTGTTYDSTRHTRRDYFINNMIQGAYYSYWLKATAIPGEKSTLPYPTAAHTILEVKNRSRFEAYKDKDYLDVWHKRYLICFESVSPDTGQTEQQQARKLIADLDHLLGIHARYETRKVKCFVLVRTSEVDKIKSNTTAASQKFEKDGPVKKIRGGYLNFITSILGEQETQPIVFDETNYKGLVDLDLPVNSWTDIPALRKALQAYDLDIKEEERDQQMLIITDKN